ncbi:MAG: hypothetical protein V4456_16195 [Bacteroidota bacterium]
MKKTAGNTLYLRFFDVKWDAQKQVVSPIAVIRIGQHSEIKGVPL